MDKLKKTTTREHIQGAANCIHKVQCMPTYLLCTPSFWKSYKVLYVNIKYLYFLSFSLVENYFVFFCLSQSFNSECFYNFDQIYGISRFTPPDPLCPKS